MFESVKKATAIALQIVFAALLGIGGGTALQSQTAKAAVCGYKCDRGTWNDECVEADPSLACEDPWGPEGCDGKNKCSS